jgi:hypothetical protein
LPSAEQAQPPGKGSITALSVAWWPNLLREAEGLESFFILGWLLYALGLAGQSKNDQYKCYDKDDEDDWEQYP